jgi:uncharacterized protein (DUF433 family)
VKTKLPNDLPVWSDPERLGGRLCFRGPRVPVDALFANLEAGMSLDEFLDEFEGVTREQAVAVLEYARHTMTETAPAAV